MAYRRANGHFRTATWPDWVKHHQESFSHGTWHYINLPFVPPGSATLASAHTPKDQNIVNILPTCVDKARERQAQRRRSTCVG